MSEKYLVDLTVAEQEYLGGLLKHGKASARKIASAHMLLYEAEGLSDEEIADMLRVGCSTIHARANDLLKKGWARAQRASPGEWQVKASGKARGLFGSSCL